MSINSSVAKAVLSSAITYGAFTYALPNEPNKNYFVISSGVGSDLGDSLVQIIMPTYTNSGTLIDTAISAGAGAGSAYLAEKLLAQVAGQPEFNQSNMMTKLGILVLANATADYVINMWMPNNGTTSVTSA